MKAMNFYTANGWVGSNYDSKLSTKEIAAKARAFAKKNFLGFKFSVRSEWSMYTDSMYIELKEGTCIPFVEGSRSAERGYMSTMNTVKDKPLTPGYYGVLDNLDNCIIESYPTKGEAAKGAEILNTHVDENGRLRSII